MNPPACRRVLWILLVVVLSVLSLSRLSSWPPPHSSSFRLDLSYVVVGSTLPTPRSTTSACFCTSYCHFKGLFPFIVVFAIGLLRPFLYPILGPLAFVPNTFYTHNLSKYSLFQSRSQYGLFQNPGLHTCFGLNLNRGFWTKPMFLRPKYILHKELFHTKAVLSTNTMFYTKTMFLLGLCKGSLQPTG